MRCGLATGATEFPAYDLFKAALGRLLNMWCACGHSIQPQHGLHRYPTAVADARAEVSSSHEVRLESPRGVASDAADLGVCCGNICAEESRARMKAEDGERRAAAIPAVEEWCGSLKGDAKDEAKKLFGRINQIATDSDRRKTLYKHGVLAFENLRHKEKLAQLGEIDANDLDTTVKLFSELDDIEASWYYQIIEGRLDMIRKLKDLTDEDALEKVIQQHICTHLWLLDPSWDRATETPSMERTVRADFERISKNLSQEERDGRIDIRYKKASGKHVIVELKRASVRTTSWTLGDQIQKYMDALGKQVVEHNEQDPVEAVCLVGHLPTDWTPQDRGQRELSMTVRGIRVMTYRSLINDAEKSYDEYLRKAEDRGRIKSLLDAIEESG